MHQKLKLLTLEPIMMLCCTGLPCFTQGLPSSATQSLTSIKGNLCKAIETATPQDIPSAMMVISRKLGARSYACSGTVEAERKRMDY